jgi:hypothetical protein
VAYHWISNWFDTTETKEQFSHSQSEFKSWIKCKETRTSLGENACNAIMELIFKKLLPVEHMWARHHRLFIFAFGEKVTSFVESLNRVIKHGPMPVHANSSLELSCSGMVNSTNERMGEKERCAAREERSTPLFSQSDTRHHLIAPGESMLINDFENRIDFRVVQSKFTLF